MLCDRGVLCPIGSSVKQGGGDLMELWNSSKVSTFLRFKGQFKFTVGNRVLPSVMVNVVVHLAAPGSSCC